MLVRFLRTSLSIVDMSCPDALARTKEGKSGVKKSNTTVTNENSLNKFRCGWRYGCADNFSEDRTGGPQDKGKGQMNQLF